MQRSALKSHGDRAGEVSLQVGGRGVSEDGVGPNCPLTRHGRGVEINPGHIKATCKSLIK